MWPFKSKKQKEAEKKKKAIQEAVDNDIRKRYSGSGISNKSVYAESNDNNILLDPLLSPLSPISPFYIGGQDESLKTDSHESHSHDYGSSHDSGNSHHDSGSSYDSCSSYDSGSSYDSSSYDSSSSSSDF